MYKHVNIKDHREPGGFYHIGYKEYGEENEHVLFCVHGILNNLHDYDNIAEKLSKKYRVICIDVPGRGISSYLENHKNYNNNFYYSGILSMLEQLNIKQVTWIGTSMGGIIGMRAAACHPEIVRRLILNDIGPFVDKGALLKVAKFLQDYKTFLTFEAACEHIRMMFSVFGIKKEEHWQHVFKYYISYNQIQKFYHFRYHKDVGYIFSSRIDNPEDFDMWTAWKRIKCPTLVLRGKISYMLTRDTITQMAQSENMDYIEYEGIGHNPSLLDDPQMSDIEMWLEETKRKITI